MNFLMLKLDILQERAESEGFGGKWHATFEGIRAELIDIVGESPEETV